MKIQLGLFIRALSDIPAWSNGSPPDSKSGRLGSNPRAGARSGAICIQIIDKSSLDGM